MRVSAILLSLALPAAIPAALPAQTPATRPFKSRPLATGPVRVGPATGTVVVVGGGAMGPEIYNAFIDAAGGPDALILDVPNAGGTDTVGHDAGQGWRNHGAHNVVALFTKDRKLADADSFVSTIRKARGVWFDGGRQFHLVQDYGGTKTERAITELLDRGGVVGGSSAGASILGDFMVRGAPSSDNAIMDYPGYETGFGYLKGVAIDQHVVARSRLPDLADSIITRYPNLLGISADEGTAWVIRGDTGRIIGRDKAFVYNGSDANDPGTPFVTLYPGDRYDLHARRVLSRAADRSPVTTALIDSMFSKYDAPGSGGATVLVAQDGAVFVDRAFGIPPQPRFMPRTTLPQFPLGNITQLFTSLCAQMADTNGARSGPPRSPLERCVARLSVPVGAHRTVATDSQHVQSSVDELYRFALGLQVPTTWRNADYSKGWTLDSYRGVSRLASYATADGRRAAFVRIRDRHATVIILTNDATADARGMSERILDQLSQNISLPFSSPDASARSPQQGARRGTP